MLLMQRKDNRKTLYIGKNSAFPAGEDAFDKFEKNIRRRELDLSSLDDIFVYKLHDIADSAAVDQILRAGKRELQIDAGGDVIGCLTWPRVGVSITGAMQLTVSNGGINDELLDLPLADRQVNVIADPIYDKLIEIAIIRNTTSGALDIWHRENEGAMPVGYELVQSLLKFTLPAGAKDLKELNLGL